MNEEKEFYCPNCDEYRPDADNGFCTNCDVNVEEVYDAANRCPDETQHYRRMFNCR